MGFLSKLFGKKDKSEAEKKQEEEMMAGEGLTEDEEAAAEAAEAAFVEEHPELAEEDIVDEEFRLDAEEKEREEAEAEEKRLAAEEKAAAEAAAAEAAEEAARAEEEAERAREEARQAAAAESARLQAEADAEAERLRQKLIAEAAAKEAAEKEAAEKAAAEAAAPAEAENAAPAEDEAATKKSFWGRLKSGLSKTRTAIFAPVDNLLKSFVKVDEDLLDELEEILISADVGMTATENILDELRARIKDGRLKEKEQVMTALREIMADMIGESEPLRLDSSPSVLMVIGVNGAGKTTSIGKISKRLRLAGKKVVVAAADTFRAAAIDQLAVWCERAGVEMVHQSEGSDPAAVVFDAIAVAKKRGADVLIIDTAGRLQNKKNLMNELSKIDRVVDRELPGASRETLLVLDATTGQNAVSQAKEFSNAAHITGITLNKLDGTAKGGIIISIKEELNIPVKFIGVGEKIDDMQEFDAQDFIKALFEA